MIMLFRFYYNSIFFFFLKIIFDYVIDCMLLYMLRSQVKDSVLN